MFKQAYIPRTLNEVKNYERDVDIMMRLKEEDMALNTQQDNVSSLVCLQSYFSQKKLSRAFSWLVLVRWSAPYMVTVKGTLLDLGGGRRKGDAFACVQRTIIGKKADSQRSLG